MNKICIHSGCTQKTYSTDSLCKFHRDEYENNGKEGHFTCSWCVEYKNHFPQRFIDSLYEMTGIEKPSITKTNSDNVKAGMTKEEQDEATRSMESIYID